MKGKAKLVRIVGMAGKITSAKQDSVSDLHLSPVERKTTRTLDNTKQLFFFSFSKTLVRPMIQSSNWQAECVYERSFIPGSSMF